MSDNSLAITAAPLEMGAVEQKEKVDEVYQNLKADLLIVSSDGVRFHVDKFYIQTVSSVFRVMLQDCTPTDTPELRLIDKVIEHSRIIRLLLDQACGTRFLDLDAIPLRDMIDLIDFCDKYDCASLLHTIKVLTCTPAAKPIGGFWRFVYACILDDIEAAHRLLPIAARLVWNAECSKIPGPAGNVPGGSCMDVTTMSSYYQSLLPPKYRHALTRANRLRMTMPAGTWQDVADDFREQVKLQEPKLPERLLLARIGRALGIVFLFLVRT